VYDFSGVAKEEEEGKKTITQFFLSKCSLVVGEGVRSQRMVIAANQPLLQQHICVCNYLCWSMQPTHNTHSLSLDVNLTV
jgi:hypothetical protein